MSKCCKQRNKFLDASILALLLISFFGGGMVVGNKMLPKDAEASTGIEAAAGIAEKTVTETVNAVLPPEGFRSKISFGDSIIKMQEQGIINKEKVEKLYASRGGIPAEMKELLENPSSKAITINRTNANYLINLLWPLGIANKNSTLAESEAGKPENVNQLAATGGWTLGNAENGGDYYNKFEIVKLTSEQDELVKRVAANIYRPCCGNSTAMPDCNHGAAMLGLLQLGAAQGLTEKELYAEAVNFNAFWFPDNYAKIAVAFKQFQGKQWKELDPKTLLSANFSSSSGYQQNVVKPLSQIPGLTSQKSGGGGCSA